MGGWTFAEPLLWDTGVKAEFVGRDPSASPAAGSNFVHKHEQAELLDAALSGRVPYRVAGAFRKKTGNTGVFPTAATQRTAAATEAAASQ